MNILIGVICIFIISYLIYLLLSYLILPKPFQRIGPDEIRLTTDSKEKPTLVITSEELKGPWTSSTGSSLIFYINPSILDRTGQSGNEYANVVQIGSKQTFQLLVAPDAGRGFQMAPAQLQIYMSGLINPETVEIPNFPMQRWTGVAIVKQGRKFNIYLNGTLSVSHMCTAMPDFDATQPLKVGDPRLGGTIAFMSIVPYALHANEVRDLYRSSVDTTGKPFLPMTIGGLFSPIIPVLPGGFWCPGGNCKIPKTGSPLEQWSSPYA